MVHLFVHYPLVKLFYPSVKIKIENVFEEGAYGQNSTKTLQTIFWRIKWADNALGAILIENKEGMESFFIAVQFVCSEAQTIGRMGEVIFVHFVSVS